MKNPLTYLNSLFETFAVKTLSGHDQLIMLHIFNQFNRSHWAKTVRISDRELQELCRLYDSTGKPVTIDTIRASKSRLKLKGLIDFKAGKGNSSTEYRIVNPPDTPPQSPRESPRESPADTSRVPYIRACEDVKTLDVKTVKKESACACETSELLDSQSVSDICDFWLKQTGWQIKGDMAYDLLAKAEDNRELTEEAIRKAMTTKGTYVLKYEHFKAVYAKLKNPPKGGEKVAKSSTGFSYKPVTFDDGEELW